MQTDTPLSNIYLHLPLLLHLRKGPHDWGGRGWEGTFQWEIMKRTVTVKILLLKMWPSCASDHEYTHTHVCGLLFFHFYDSVLTSGQKSKLQRMISCTQVGFLYVSHHYLPLRRDQRGGVVDMHAAGTALNCVYWHLLHCFWHCVHVKKVHCNY